MTWRVEVVWGGLGWLGWGLGWGLGWVWVEVWVEIPLAC